jgi:hypothetical protein
LDLVPGEQLGILGTLDCARGQVVAVLPMCAGFSVPIPQAVKCTDGTFRFGWPAPFRLERLDQLGSILVAAVRLVLDPQIIFEGL